MNSFIENLCKRNQITYQPEQWSKRLGEKCNNCSKSLTHQKCVSLCKCYYFCHQQCFVQKFQLQIYDQATDIKCQKCGYDLQLLLESQYKYDPSFDKRKLLKLSISLVLLLLAVGTIIFTLNSNIRMEIAFFLLYLQGLFLSIFLYMLVLDIRNIFYRKLIKIKEVLSTKLQIQTSAFKDLEIDFNEELTKQCLIISKK